MTALAFIRSDKDKGNNNDNWLAREEDVLVMRVFTSTITVSRRRLAVAVAVAVDFDVDVDVDVIGMPKPKLSVRPAVARKEGWFPAACENTPLSSGSTRLVRLSRFHEEEEEEVAAGCEDTVVVMAEVLPLSALDVVVGDCVDVLPL